MTSSKNNCIVKTALVVGLVLVCILLGSCGKSVRHERIDEGKMNAGLITAYNDTAMENAIIAQHTLYPYHFVNNGTQLNELGRRDLSILAKHFKDNPGELNVSRDDVSDVLYQERVTCVTKQLKQDGVDLSKLTISDGMPGGSRMAANDVLQIKEADQKARQSRRESYPQTSSGMSSGSSSGLSTR
jgi:hypothetical protein